MVAGGSQSEARQERPGHQQVVHVVEGDGGEHQEHPQQVDGDQELQDEEEAPGHGEGQGGGDGRGEGAGQQEEQQVAALGPKRSSHASKGTKKQQYFSIF